MNLDIVKRYYTTHSSGYGSHGGYDSSGGSETRSNRVNFFADYWWIFVIIVGTLVVGFLLVYFPSKKYFNVVLENGHLRWHRKAKDEIVPGWRGFIFRKKTPVLGPSSYPSPPRDAFSTQYPTNGYVPQSSRGPGAYQAPQAYETLQVYPNQGHQTATQDNALPPKYEVTHDNGTAGTVSSSSEETYERPSGPPPAHIR